MRICLLLFSVIISSFILGETALAQEINIYETFKNPDITHKKERPYNDQLAEILMRRKEAIQASNDFKLAQSFYLEMLIKDKIKEDSSFITNSLYIDSLAKTSQNRPALKLSVQLLKAQRIRQYLNLGINIQKRVALSTEKSIRWLQMPEDSLQQEIQSSLYAAKAVLHQIGNYPLSDYLWLSGDPLFFWFKPDLAAIVYGEGINLLHKGFLPQMVMEWLQKKEFPIRIESITDTALAPVLAWHKQWQEKDILNDEQKYFFEIQLTKNLYAGVEYSDSLENLYKNYLQCHITSKFSCVRAFTAFQLFLIDHKNGKSFNSSRGIKADSSHCFAYKNALSIYRAHHQVLDSFFMAKEIILKAVGNIEKRNLPYQRSKFFYRKHPPNLASITGT
ncbi:hypothetical protein [Flavihumibacter sp. CACIAM 22H1]|uniref:hypothetical protein n=1 Tax=Flavihumibacter sp. CACIAM 22H1 TaxID=1812911 RepID=UPI000ADFEE1C|nr:hypothetical protein [Flavihumibacter sp. CACIAM 22H1]